MSESTDTYRAALFLSFPLGRDEQALKLWDSLEKSADESSRAANIPSPYSRRKDTPICQAALFHREELILVGFFFDSAPERKSEKEEGEADGEVPGRSEESSTDYPRDPERGSLHADRRRIH